MDARELRQYERFKDEAQHLRAMNLHLRQELGACQPELYRACQRIDRLEQANRRYRDENKRLKQKLADLTARLQQQTKPAPPPFVKPNVPTKRRRRPGGKKGHPADLRPKPEQIDQHEQVPLPVDAHGKPCCPECRSQLSRVAQHQRLVEELVPAQRLTTGPQLASDSISYDRACAIDCLHVFMPSPLVQRVDGAAGFDECDPAGSW